MRVIGCSGGEDGRGKCLVLRSSATGAAMRRWRGLGLGKRTATLQFWGRCSCCASGLSCRRVHVACTHAMLFQFTVMLNCVQKTSTLVTALEDPCATAAIALAYIANCSTIVAVAAAGAGRAASQLHLSPCARESRRMPAHSPRSRGRG